MRLDTISIPAHRPYFVWIIPSADSNEIILDRFDNLGDAVDLAKRNNGYVTYGYEQKLFDSNLG